MSAQTERPCKPYEKGSVCKDGRDHCFNCGRHLDNERCSRRCGESGEANDDAANNEETES